MGTIDHPLVGDRVIEGTGTSSDTWQNWHGLHELSLLSTDIHFPRSQRVCLFAPHPDDEILGCGGLIQQLSAQGNEIVLISVTNGTQSHPDSQLYSPNDLNVLRPLETQAALTALNLAHPVRQIALQLDDGAVHLQKNELMAQLSQIIQTEDILVAPFVHDGHPDHEATGQVVQEFATKHGLRCYQVLIWAWHWAVPNDTRIPWQQALKLKLSPRQQQLKRQAASCFSSQLTADPTTGQPAVLSFQTIERITQPWEVYIDGSRGLF